MDWSRDRDGRGQASDADALSRLEEHAKRLGQRFGELQPEDREAFALVGYDDWSFGWKTEVVDAAQRLLGGLTKLEEKRELFLQRFGLPEAAQDAGDCNVGRTGWGVDQAAEHEIGFSLGSDGQAALDDLDQLIEHLQEYRQARDALSTQYEAAKVAMAPLEEWEQELRVISTKPWPLKVFALRAFRGRMRSALGVDQIAAPSPERDLRTLRVVSDLLHTLKTVSSRVPRPSPWRGLGSDLESVRTAIGAARLLRRAVATMAGFGRDLPTVRDSIARVLIDQREALGPDMPVGASAVEFSSAYEQFKPLLDDFMVKARILEMPMNLDALKAGVSGIVVRENRLNIWCQWIAARVKRPALDFRA